MKVTCQCSMGVLLVSAVEGKAWCAVATLPLATADPPLELKQIGTSTQPSSAPFTTVLGSCCSFTCAAIISRCLASHCCIFHSNITNLFPFSSLVSCDYNQYNSSGTYINLSISPCCFKGCPSPNGVMGLGSGGRGDRLGVWATWELWNTVHSKHAYFVVVVIYCVLSLVEWPHGGRIRYGHFLLHYHKTHLHVVCSCQPSILYK